LLLHDVAKAVGEKREDVSFDVLQDFVAILDPYCGDFATLDIRVAKSRVG